MSWTTLPPPGSAFWRDGVATSAQLPASGSVTGECRIAQDTGFIYYWSGSAWVAVPTSGSVPTSRTISTTAPLTGGGDLSANRTIAIPAATDSVDGYLTAADHASLTGKVTGPASATDNGIVRYDGTTGKLVQNATNVIIDDSGNMGVGTTNPQTKLDVGGAATATGIVETARFSAGDGISVISNSTYALSVFTTDYNNSTTGSAVLAGLGATTGNTYGRIQVLTSGASAVGNLSLQNLGGSVGVGTTAPGTLLHVKGSGNPRSKVEASDTTVAGLQLTTNSTDWYIDNRGALDSPNNRLAISSTSEMVTILYSGNVGIGTTSPGATLHAVGTAKVGTTGAITASTTLEVSGTTGAFLLPRLTTTQRDALTATAGMVIYNTSTDRPQCYIGGATAAWTNLCGWGN